MLQPLLSFLPVAVMIDTFLFRNFSLLLYSYYVVQPRKINPASWQPHHVGRSGLPWVERCDHARRANLRPSTSTNSASASFSFLVESSRQRRHSQPQSHNSDLAAPQPGSSGNKSHRELLRADHVYRRLPPFSATITEPQQRPHSSSTRKQWQQEPL